MGTYLTRAKFWSGKKSLDFSPEIARSGRHKLMQYKGWVFGACLERIGQKEYFTLTLVGGFPDACIAT